MDHAYIEEHQIADRYVQGTLPEAERERFEDHYLSCQECLDRLELAESVQRGFQRMAAQDLERLSAARQLAVVAWLTRLGRSRQMAVLVMALLVFAILPVGVALRGFSGSAGHDQELARTRSALEQERQRSSAEARSAAEAEKRLQASQSDLAAEREARARTQEQLAQAFQPEANTPILNLDVERGGGTPGDKPTNLLRLPASVRWVVLAPQVEPPFHSPYRAILRDGHGRELRRIEGLQPNEREALSLSLPTSLLPPGDYSLSVEGLTPGGKPIPAGRFTFRVLLPA
jgi:anti-sigma factor RsiW